MCGILFAVESLSELVRRTSEAYRDVADQFYCTFCSEYFDSQEALNIHCQSSGHKFNVSSDKEHQWNYRSPPWTVSGGNFTICDK